MSAKAHFYLEKKYNARKSEEEQRPVYDDVEMVEISLPQDTRCIHSAYASEMVFQNGKMRNYRERFPKEYEAFKSGQDQRATGTPLERLGSLSPAMIAECQSIGVYSIEALAEITEHQSRRLGFNGAHLRKMAADYLEVADNLKDKREKDVMEQRIAKLEEQLAAATRFAPKAKKTEAKTEGDEFDAMSDDELKEVIKGFGGDVPPGNAKRETLLARAREVAAEARASADA